MENLEEIIKDTVAELLKAMKFDGQLVLDRSDPDNILVSVQTDQAPFLIGQAGVNLDAFQYLARILASKRANEPVYFLLDVNNYRQHRINMLKQMVKNIAEQALSEKAMVTLQPMPAYERRIVHIALLEYPQLVTESVGQDQDRHIVIKFAK